jgi:hypothetical protein
MKAKKGKVVIDPNIAGYQSITIRSRHEATTDGRAVLYLYDDREHHRSRDP